MMKTCCGAVLALVVFYCGSAYAQAPASGPPAGGQAEQGTAAAPPPQTPAPWQGRGWGRWFVDADRDGVCDNWTTSGRGFANRAATGWGPAFVDANRDGICDNFPGTGRRGQGRRLGPGATRTPGTGQGAAANALAGRGRGRGWR